VKEVTCCVVCSWYSWDSHHLRHDVGGRRSRHHAVLQPWRSSTLRVRSQQGRTS